MNGCSERSLAASRLLLCYQKILHYIPHTTHRQKERSWPFFIGWVFSFWLRQWHNGPGENVDSYSSGLAPDDFGRDGKTGHLESYDEPCSELRGMLAHAIFRSDHVASAIGLFFLSLSPPNQASSSVLVSSQSTPLPFRTVAHPNLLFSRCHRMLINCVNVATTATTTTRQSPLDRIGWSRPRIRCDRMKFVSMETFMTLPISSILVEIKSSCLAETM